MATPRTSDGECGPAPLPPATAERSKRAVVAKTAHIDTGSVAPSLNEKHQELAAQQPGWTSTYLQKTTLLGFAVIFFSLLLAVIALAVVDAKQDGIANAKSNEHYLWTYGPTAGTFNPNLFRNDLTGVSLGRYCCVLESDRIPREECDALDASPERLCACVRGPLDGLRNAVQARSSDYFSAFVALAGRYRHYEFLLDHLAYSCIHGPLGVGKDILRAR